MYRTVHGPNPIQEIDKYCRVQIFCGAKGGYGAFCHFVFQTYHGTFKTPALCCYAQQKFDPF